MKLIQNKVIQGIMAEVPPIQNKLMEFIKSLRNFKSLAMQLHPEKWKKLNPSTTVFRNQILEALKQKHLNKS